MNIKEIMLKRETLYSQYACKDEESIHLKEFTSDIRPNYFRDIDRIIHSNAYTRYMGKTQVFTKFNNDHVSKRMTHVQFVSKIARTIARALSLNEDLTEAIALGHDLGHVPFGHPGESILNEISLNNKEGFFNHNIQSVRLLMDIENQGEGKNISLQVLDGIMCHNGEFANKKYLPKKKSIDDFFEDYNYSYEIPGYVNTLIPMTLEGCVVRLSDMIAYLGRDIEDAIRLGVFDEQDIPENIKQLLGVNNKDIINNIIIDVINNSIDKPYIELSQKMHEAIEELKKFNYKNIYYKANTKKTLNKMKIMFNTLFNYYLNALNKQDASSDIFNEYLYYKNDNYKANSNARIVLDFLAGMTDDYFLKKYKKINK